MDQVRFEVKVHSITAAADDIHTFDLRPVEGTLPPFEPGSHVDVHLPTGVVRSYSLMNDSSEHHRYVLGISRDRASRGGSAWLHDALRVSARLHISAPRNNFRLDETAAHSILIAGGIGITPLWSMVQRLERLQKPWTFYYSARTRQSAALVGELEGLAASSNVGKLILNFDQQSGGKMLDLPSIVMDAPLDAHFYCCGPIPMLDAFIEACKSFAAENVHYEYFTPKDSTTLEHGGFMVLLSRSGKRIQVEKDQTILDAVRAEGIAVPSSCEQGICGACETKVLQGVPEHRDLVLSAKERSSNEVMMICCSGSNSSLLVLDI